MAASGMSDGLSVVERNCCSSHDFAGTHQLYHVLGYSVEGRQKENQTGPAGVRRPPAILVTSTLTAELGNGVTWAAAPAGSAGSPAIPQAASQPAGRQAASSPRMQGATEPLGLKGVRRLAAKGGELVWLSIPWEQWKVSAACWPSRRCVPI